VIDLGDYRVDADQPSDGSAIVVLRCDICGQSAGRGDVRWWDPDYSPSMPELVAEAEAHERKGHTP
jgi:hypothetical protein